MINKKSKGIIPYPRGFGRVILRAPLYLYQMGLAWVMHLLPFFVLVTRGRKSGLPRPVVLEYRKHGSKYYVVSGWGERPQWYKNLKADPLVTLQFGTQLVRARAFTVEDPAEALRALYMFRRGSPLHERVMASMSSAKKIDLRTLTEVSNEFTVVRLELEPGEIPLEGLRVRNRWLPPLVLGTLLLSIFLSFRTRGDQ